MKLTIFDTQEIQMYAICSYCVRI